MWLLDANLDIHLLELLRSFQIDCDTAENRDWKSLRNGDLAAAAAEAGFRTLLTRPAVCGIGGANVAGASGSEPGHLNSAAITFRPLSGSVQDGMGSLADSPVAGQDRYLAETPPLVFRAASIILIG